MLELRHPDGFGYTFANTNADPDKYADAYSDCFANEHTHGFGYAFANSDWSYGYTFAHTYNRTNDSPPAVSRRGYECG